nr:uncharacterized protein LOC113703806 [Coffea arabica]
MKFSLKLQDTQHQQQPQQPQQSNQIHSLLFRAKIPVTIFNLPFLSGFSTTTHHPSDLSLSLSTHFPSGPTLKLSYSTTSSTTATTASTAANTSTTTPPPPLTLTLKSGIGQYGSPKESPLIISANFSFSPNNPTSNPTFSILFKPRLGSFSLRKSTFSSTPGSPSGKINGEASSFGFVPLERPVNLKDFSLENNGKDSIFKGISMMARTEMPLAKRVLMTLRWGVNFPDDLSNQLPYMAVNKIGIERVDQVKEVEGGKQKRSEGNIGGDSELLKGMCLWMKRELDMLQRENREMKHKLEEMRLGPFGRNGGSSGALGETNRKKTIPVVEESSGFEQWRSKKHGGEENSKKEVKKNGNRLSDVESELERAIKAASSS